MLVSVGSMRERERERERGKNRKMDKERNRIREKRMLASVESMKLQTQK